MIKILYEDNHVIAVLKPAGVLVQKDETNEDSLIELVKEYLKEKYKKPGNVFLGMVHRLDRNVSGIVLFGKTSKGASRLSEQFRNDEIIKIYHAIVEGKTSKEGELVHFLKKDTNKRKALVSDLDSDGYDRSELAYKTIKTNKKFSLIKINLKTGRFHQIRAQLSAIGHPIAGDTKYGFKIQNSKFKIPISGIALCATEITFKTATNEEVKNIKIDYPKEWNQFY